TVTATSAATWPTDVATTVEPRAYWRNTAVAPVHLCVQELALDDVTAARLISPGTTPERVYTLGAARPSTPDLLLEPCTVSSGSTPATIRYGVLQEALPPPSRAIGTPVT